MVKCTKSAVMYHALVDPIQLSHCVSRCPCLFTGKDVLLFVQAFECMSSDEEEGA